MCQGVPDLQSRPVELGVLLKPQAIASASFSSVVYVAQVSTDEVAHVLELFASVELVLLGKKADF